MKRIKSIVIVGGGSSGWMAAAYMSKLFYDLDITVIESKRVPVIGVGEATLPSLLRFMNRIGLNDIRSWLKECDGSIKAGISFRNWLKPGDAFWHPFEGLEYVDDRHHTGHCWLQLNERADARFSTKDTFYRSFHTTHTLNHEQGCGPMSRSFAFNLDAERFARVLMAQASSVKHIQDDVVDVLMTEAGAIDAVRTTDHGAIRGDLFIDCTGFRRLLINRVCPNQTYKSYASSLFCDSAAVLRFPYADDAERRRDLRPYVTASAQSSGWIWTIPLYSRLSSGYVFSSQFQSDSDAEHELRRYWGLERTKNVDAQFIRFQTGKLGEIWHQNCVAIGLSAGFIEPLESTGLAITQLGLELLGSMLDARYYDTATSQRYNLHLDKLCTDIVEFIISHYVFTERDDTDFWRAVRCATSVPESLNARLEVFKRHLPTVDTKSIDELWFFRDYSWFAVLLGMNFRFEIPKVSEQALAKAVAISQRNAQLVRKARARPHYDYLRNEVYEKQVIPLPSSRPHLGGSDTFPIDERNPVAAATSS